MRVEINIIGNSGEIPVKSRLLIFVTHKVKKIFERSGYADFSYKINQIKEEASGEKTICKTMLPRSYLDR